MLQCNTIFKTILFEERLNKITIYFKRQQNKTKTFTVYRVHYLKFIEKRQFKRKQKSPGKKDTNIKLYVNRFKENTK